MQWLTAGCDETIERRVPHSSLSLASSGAFAGPALYIQMLHVEHVWWRKCMYECSTWNIFVYYSSVQLYRYIAFVMIYMGLEVPGHSLDRWPIQARFWLEWGSSTLERSSPLVLSSFRVVDSDRSRAKSPL